MRNGMKSFIRSWRRIQFCRPCSIHGGAAWWGTFSRCKWMLSTDCSLSGLYKFDKLWCSCSSYLTEASEVRRIMKSLFLISYVKPYAFLAWNISVKFRMMLSEFVDNNFERTSIVYVQYENSEICFNMKCFQLIIIIFLTCVCGYIHRRALCEMSTIWSFVKVKVYSCVFCTFTSGTSSSEFLLQACSSNRN